MSRRSWTFGAFLVPTAIPSQRRLIAELLHARGRDVVHLLTPGRTEPHTPWAIAETRGAVLFLCGERLT